MGIRSVLFFLALIASGVANAIAPNASHDPNPAPLAAPATTSESWQRYEFRTLQDLALLVEKYRFGPKYWKQSDKTVPRLYISDIPASWGQKTAPGLTVQGKKIAFIYLMGPSVLAANEVVAKEREELQRLLALKRAGTGWDATQMQWLQALAKRYDVGSELNDRALDELLLRVDIVPASLVLAQAATESGWGTSRFAARGNALFGQWTYGSDGIVPLEQRTATLGNYRVRAFESPMASIGGYLLNLNTHRSYADLRQFRAQMRKAGKPLSGMALAAGLSRYSERGQIYVDEVRALIRRNSLQEADFATLRDMTPILLVVVGKGAD